MRILFILSLIILSLILLIWLALNKINGMMSDTFDADKIKAAADAQIAAEKAKRGDDAFEGVVMSPRELAQYERLQELRRENKLRRELLTIEVEIVRRKIKKTLDELYTSMGRPGESLFEAMVLAYERTFGSEFEDERKMTDQLRAASEIGEFRHLLAVIYDIGSVFKTYIIQPIIDLFNYLKDKLGMTEKQIRSASGQDAWYEYKMGIKNDLQGTTSWRPKTEWGKSFKSGLF